jgi:hypothetical protein
LPELPPTAHETAFRTALDEHRRRQRLVSSALATLAGTAAGSLALLLLRLAGFGRAEVVAAAIAVTVVVTLLAGGVWWTRWRPQRTALTIDRAGALDNLVVTAEEIAGGRARTLRTSLADEIFREATDRLRRYPPALAAPLGRPLALGGGALLAFITIRRSGGRHPRARRPARRGHPTRLHPSSGHLGDQPFECHGARWQPCAP